MSGDFNGPLSEIAKHFAQYAALPPDKKSAARTSYGSLILVACAYTAFELPDTVHEYPLVLAIAAGFGLLLFVVGLRGPRLPPDPMARFWSGLWAVAFGAGSWWLANNLPDWWANVWLRGFCLSFAIAQGIEFLLLLRPISNDAERPVRENMEAKNPPIVPVRRGR